MGKQPKQKPRQVSLHSRAARRATSPSLAGNVSASLKDIKPPSRSRTAHLFASPGDSVLRKRRSSGAGNSHATGGASGRNGGSAGVTKRKAQKQMKRGQLERRRRGIERAGVVREKLDEKVLKSLGRGRVRRERAGEWEGVNRGISAGFTTAGGFPGGKDGRKGGGKDGEDEGEGGLGEAESGEPFVKDLPVRIVERVESDEMEERGEGGKEGESEVDVVE